MAILQWDETGKHLYETGVQEAALYVQDAQGAYPLGVAWDGLISVNESPSGAESSPFYANGIKYLDLTSTEELGASIEAYTYPDEFAKCDGSAEISPGVMIGQQGRSSFGLVYKTLIGNDVDQNDHGFKIHLIYGAKAAPSEKAYSTVTDSPEPISLSWELTTTPVKVAGFKPTANLVIDSTKVDATELAALLEVIYGSEAIEPKLPSPVEVAAMFTAG